jgi:hypothetical protein
MEVAILTIPHLEKKLARHKTSHRVPDSDMVQQRTLVDNVTNHKMWGISSMAKRTAASPKKKTLFFRFMASRAVTVCSVLDHIPPLLF